MRYGVHSARTRQMSREDDADAGPVKPLSLATRKVKKVRRLCAYSAIFRANQEN